MQEKLQPADSCYRPQSAQHSMLTERAAPAAPHHVQAPQSCACQARTVGLLPQVSQGPQKCHLNMACLLTAALPHATC